jgi:ADP-heptose:LPS heptosyltransferase
METNRRQFQTAKKMVLRALVFLAYGVFLRSNPKSSAKDVSQPKRILLLNGFHIGDVIIATSVIPILRAVFPSAEIGFVTGSWSQMVVKKHPGVKYTHCVDHWRINRGEASSYRKLSQYRKSRSIALKEIRELNYDVAICLNTHFPDFLDLSWTAKIPVRIGFGQSILSCLATDLVDEPESPFVHQGARLAETLRALPIDPAHFRLRHSTLADSDTSSIQEVCSLLQVSCLEDTPYGIIHMGAGLAFKELPVSFWRELAGHLSETHTVVFTGRGKRENENIAEAIYGLRNCVNACDRLTWDGFVAAVQYAEVLYGVDTMAGHVAGALETKCVVVSAGSAGVARWRPEGKDSIVFTNHVPCAPCLRSMGCASMTCIQGLSPDDLIRFDH